jgi:hypothetical protein
VRTRARHALRGTPGTEGGPRPTSAPTDARASRRQRHTPCRVHALPLVRRENGFLTQMGNTVAVAPTAERAAELTVGLPSAATRAAELLQDASFVLVCLGSGATHGPKQELPGEIFEGAARRERELGVDDLARDPAAYYGYWGRRFNANRETQRQDNPVMSFVHECCRTAGGDLPLGQEWYVFTAETDGCALAATSAARSSSTNCIHGLYECFGSTESWRCAGGCHGLWRAPDGFLFHVDHATGEAPGGDPGAKPTFHRVTMSHHDAMDYVSTSRNPSLRRCCCVAPV